MRSITMVVALAMLGTAGCRIAGPDNDEVFTLAPGESFALGTTGLTVTFIGVPADSRCASTVTCVWIGDAAAAIEWSAADGSRLDTLHTGLEPSAAEWRGVRLALTELSPYPDGTPIDPGAYRVTLEATLP